MELSGRRLMARVFERRVAEIRRRLVVLNGCTAELMRQATVAPKRRVKTKVPLGQKRRRLEEKKARGEVKEGSGWER